MTGKSLTQARREYERLLAAIFTLLIQCGVRHSTVSDMTHRALATAMAKTHNFRDSDGSELATLGLILDAWHRDRQYLTSKGAPKAVPLLGDAPSVEALIRNQGRQLDAVELAHRILSLQLIVPCARRRYRPAGDAAIVSSYGPTVLQYVARCLMSFLGTVEHNLGAGPQMPPLLERFAEVPTLPFDRVESFMKFSRSQGAAFMRIINDWLETRRVRTHAADARKTVRAGIRLHVYIAPNEEGTRVDAGSRRRASSLTPP